MRKTVIWGGSFAIIAVLAGYGYLQFSGLKSDAKEAEIKQVLNSIFTSEDSYKKGFGKYTAHLEETGFRVALPEFSIFTDGAAAIPEGRKFLKDDQIPFVSDKSFKILLRAQLDGEHLEYWTINDRQEITKVYP